MHTAATIALWDGDGSDDFKHKLFSEAMYEILHVVVDDDKNAGKRVSAPLFLSKL